MQTVLALSLVFPNGSSIETARRFLSEVGLRAMAQIAPSSSAQSNGTEFRFGAAGTVTVDRQGRVVDFTNSGRVFLAPHAKSKESFYERARGMAERVRHAAKLSSEFKLAPVRPTSGAFNAFIRGYSYFSYGRQAVFEFDPQRNELLRYHLEDRSEIESSQRKISSAKALAIAKRKLLPIGLSAAVPPSERLGFTLPNGLFGGLLYSPTPPYRLRLAYRFLLVGRSAGSIWIDAANGQILGGSVMRTSFIPPK